MTGGGRSSRSRPPVNFLLHTEEGNASADSLARYCDGRNGVSYHYTLRDGILATVVDTDYASWSVLDANAFTLNLCFAGSRSGWTRADWLARERDIEIAAFVAVEDCRKYGIPPVVVAPPYHETAGISDHRYVTDCLGIGDHTDVGPGFPWDVFTNYVHKYAGVSGGGNEEDMSWGEIIKNLDGQDVSREDLARWTDKNVNKLLRVGIAILDQLAGPGVGEAVANGTPAKFDGFEQGGNRSLYNLTAATAAKTGVAGARDVKAAK
ncbi:N-acetylmuramoyl-L-alanine amidase [Nocardia salmonicida]|uniref:N-acetylmuramoyl-L-alanine amidase n=1 Tax=Nocardia salmonicida TaxID=53431 RepID=UPI0033EC9F25